MTGRILAIHAERDDVMVAKKIIRKKRLEKSVLLLYVNLISSR